MEALDPEVLEPEVLDAMARSMHVQYDVAPVGFLCLTADGRIGRINRTLLGWLQYEREDLVGKRRFHDLTGAGARLYFETQHMTLLLLQGHVHDIAADLVARDGTRVPVLVNTVLERDDDGQPLFMHMSLFHAGERRRYERELLHAKQQAEQAALTLDRRVMERTRELACALDRAESAVRAKNDFLANMSHEIRTPLNCMLGMARLLRDTIGTQPEADYLDSILQAGDGVVRIVGDILDFCRMDAGKLDIEMRPVDVRALVTATASRYAALAGARGLDFVVDVDPDVPREGLGDALRLSQILSNYLDNAIKFTERGRVAVRARMAGGRLRIEVRDTGIGVPPDRQAHLFQPFCQADSSTTRKYGGTGLGLAICRQLAQLMDGAVGMTGAGTGSTFWCEVAFAAAPAQARAVPAQGDDPDALRARASIAGCHVLLAEDNPLNQKLVRIMMERAGVAVTVAGDGAQALAALAAAPDRPFDCVLMDVQMPVMDGWETTRRLRADPALRYLPVIALTANALDTNRTACLDAGMDAFLTKPIDAALLYRTLAGRIGAAAAPDRAPDSPPSAASPRAAAPDRATPADATSDDADDDALDHDALAAFAELVDGDRDAMAELLALFFANADATLAELAAALVGQDLDAAAGLGHRLKSSAQAVGAAKVAAACRAVENAGSLAEAATLHASLPGLLGSARAGLARKGLLRRSD